MKKKSFTLHLKKTKIVNLTTTKQLVGGARGTNITVCYECHNTTTIDKPNTNNGVPTLDKKKTKANEEEPPAEATLSCAPCI
ncbi:MAG: hypothetical protein AAF611_22970 [Bacteroidota bacterium]